MEDLNGMTAAELVELHNAEAPEGDRVRAPWKRSTAELVEMIRRGRERAATRLDATDRVLGDHGPADGEPEAAEDDSIRPKKTVRALAETLLSGADATAPLTYAEIAERIRRKLPGSRTSARCIAWYATQMRKRGETVRIRLASRSSAVG